MISLTVEQVKEELEVLLREYEDQESIIPIFISWLISKKVLRKNPVEEMEDHYNTIMTLGTSDSIPKKAVEILFEKVINALKYVNNNPA